MTGRADRRHVRTSSLPGAVLLLEVGTWLKRALIRVEIVRACEAPACRPRTPTRLTCTNMHHQASWAATGPHLDEMQCRVSCSRRGEVPRLRHV